MHEGGLMYMAFIFLLAAVISVPIAKRLGLGSVLGYLMAGAAIGPFALQLVGHDMENIMHFAEFGVVMMLFLVGLELQPSLLWKMRLPILGLGGLQVLLTSLAIAGLGILLGYEWQHTLAVGLILSLSSTAIVLQSMNEKGLMPTEAGQSSFAVLLFQDIAVIPMLAVLPLLAVQEMNLPNASHAGLAGWQQGLLVIATMAGIVVAGRVLIRPLFRIIASTGLREIFTATALLLVIAIALLMESIGLSAALGTFMAGVVLANSEYRHELEAEIEPFKGLLLGLFFISVGASIDFALFMQMPMIILSLVLALIAIKFAVLIGLAKLFKLQSAQQWTFTFALAQGGEFCFVLFSFTSQNQILPESIASPLIVVVALSMALTPLLMIINERFVQPLFNKTHKQSRPADTIDDGGSPVIIAGYGRFGQVIGRSLNANGIRTTVLEHDANQIEQLRKFQHKVFYGDASRHDLLEAAGAHHAKLIVLALDDHEKIKQTVLLCQKHFPHLKIYARAMGRIQAHELDKLNVEVFVRETFHSALHLSEMAMQGLGMHPYDAHRVMRTFKKLDEQHIRDMRNMEVNEKNYISMAQKNKAELERVLQADANEQKLVQDAHWDQG